MRRYIDLDTLQLQRRISGYPVSEETARHGALWELEIQFVRDCVVVDLGDEPSERLLDTDGTPLLGEDGKPLLLEGPDGILALKAPGAYNATAFVVSGSWLKEGSGATAVYKFRPSLTGVAIDSILGNADDAPLNLEIHWSYGPQIFKTSNPVTLLVTNSVVRGNETAAESYPAAAQIIQLEDIVNVTGGVFPTDLDAIPLAAYTPGSIFEIEIDVDGALVGSRLQKDAWTDPSPPVTSVGEGLIVTLDYNASTNPYILRLVSGVLR